MRQARGYIKTTTEKGERTPFPRKRLDQTDVIFKIF